MRVDRFTGRYFAQPLPQSHGDCSGSVVENLYALSSFGIPPNSFPLHPTTGDVKVDAWKGWLRDRQEIESDANSVGSSARGPRPTDLDIILGRGKVVQKHAGNIRLRGLVDAHLVIYENARPLQKTEIAEQIVNHIKALTGRFLKPGDQGWEEVEDTIAREKVSHTFRDRRRKLKQKGS